jgi:hypothetical protein
MAPAKSGKEARMFSRPKGGSDPGPGTPGGDAPSAVAGAATSPWGADQDVAAELAIGSLLKFFPKSLAQHGRLQVETLFCAVGAVAGFAAQHAVRQRHVASGNAQEAEVFMVAQAANGERYYFGDRLNAILVPETLHSTAVFSIVGGAALRLGAARQELPDCMEIFERAAKSLGTPDFGVPRLPPGHRPFLSPRRAIEIFWPSIVQVLTREPIVPVPGFKLVEPRHWPLVLAAVAASCMPATAASLSPALAVKIFMEAAIPMSKIDQSAVRFVGATQH